MCLSTYVERMATSIADRLHRDARANRRNTARIVAKYATVPCEYVNGAKFKWILDENNYRTAVVTKNGVLQVKSVTNSLPQYHTDDCTCRICSLNARLQWVRPRPKLKLTFFQSEQAWRASLPSNGKVHVMLAPVSDTMFQIMCTTPLVSASYPLKLRELERRFPGAGFTLNTANGPLSVWYIYEDLYADPIINHRICCENCNSTLSKCDFHFDFKSVGGGGQLILHLNKQKVDVTNLI